MTHILFEQLENAGLVRGDKVIKKQILKTAPSRLIDLSQESSELTSAQEMQRENALFVHSASLSLGGGRKPCSTLECRLDRANELAQFASFYSDRVYIDNFIARHAAHSQDSEKIDADDYHETFFNDLTVLAKMKPLIDAGLIIPVTMAEKTCPYCLATHSFGPNADKRFDRELQRLEKRFLEGTSVKLRKIGDRYHFSYKGPDTLRCNVGGLTTKTLPPALRKNRRIMKQIETGNIVSISRAIRKEIGMHKALVYDVYVNIVFELAAAQCLNTTFLTEIPLHLEILNSLSEDPKLEQRNQIFQKHLTSIVPFAAQVDYKDLLEIRNSENESFIIFRQSLNKAIDELRTLKANFTEKDAKSLYSDVVAPKLALLDVKVKTAERKLIKGSLRKVGSWIGAISFGLYTGLIPGELIKAASALGLINIVAELAEKISASRSIPEELRSENMYFLWQVRRKAKPK